MYKNMLFGCYNSQEIYFKKNIANETYDNKVHNNLKNYTKNKTRKIISTPWTQAEDELLEEKYKQYGNKFSLILKFFPNKTINSIKNRINFINKSKIKNIFTKRIKNMKLMKIRSLKHIIYLKIFLKWIMNKFNLLTI